MMKNILTHLIIAFLSFSTLTAQAIEYQSPRTLGLGGAGRGGPLLNDAIFLNPSYGSFNNVYSLNVGYTGFNSGRNYDVSVQDARTEMFQAGAAYTKREQNGAINIGASKMVIKQVGAGLGTKILVDNGTNKMTSDLIFSTTFIATQWMYSALIIDNIFQGSEAKARNLYRTLFFGFKFMPMHEIEIFVDPLYSPDYTAGKKAGFSAGVEFALLADFYLRVGKSVDGEVSYLNTRGDGFGFGLGWIGPRINFDYAMHRVTSSHAGNGLTTAHAGGVTVFF